MIIGLTLAWLCGHMCDFPSVSGKPLTLAGLCMIEVLLDVVRQLMPNFSALKGPEIDEFDRFLVHMGSVCTCVVGGGQHTWLPLIL